MDQSPGRVEILLATRNSAAHLAPLLESLLAQSWDDFRLVVGDDCSTDGTLDVLAAHAGRFRHPVEVVRREVPSGSAAANFALLMQASRGDHVLLCDADDLWDPDKVEALLALALAAGADAPAGVPVFGYSDARVVDGDGRPLHPSYWRFKRIDPWRCNRLERLLVCPPMLGCASVMNRALVERARDVPVGRVTGHDWWAILVACVLGRIAVLPRPTISYRVHGANASQPKEVAVGALLRTGAAGAARGPLGKARGSVHEVRRRLAIRRRQAEPLLERFGPELRPDQRAAIEGFLAVEGRSFLGRRLALLRGGYLYPDPVRALATLALC